jgi:3-(3-hydroxy-phenyl)propionate hydroxylase
MFVWTNKVALKHGSSRVNPRKTGQVTMSKAEERVIVVGAGPVGLVATTLLAEAGVPVTLVESSTDLPRDLRASTFHPPTLDMLERFGVVPDMISQGLICPTWQFRDREHGVVATFELGLLSGDTNHPYRLQCEQWRLSEMMFARLQKMTNVEVRFGVKALGVTQSADHASVEIEAADGTRENLKGRFVVGSDGLKSAVRAAIGVEMEGQTIPEIFLTLSTTYDYREAMPDLSNISYISDPKEWFVLIRTKSLWRVLIPSDPTLSDADITDPVRMEARLQNIVPRSTPYEVRHKTAYRVHERVASAYVSGRVLLAGDAAHVNNPLGGMGLNGGIHDAFNLAEKLIAVFRGEADLASLSRYERQRRKVALDVVQQTTLRNRSILNSTDPAVRLAYQNDLRQTVADPVRHRDYVLRTSMIQSLRDLKAVA